MRKRFIGSIAVSLMWVVHSAAVAAPVDELINGYHASGAGPFSARAGNDLWHKPFTDNSENRPRSCASCHTGNPKNAGRHVRTQKPITPMAPSVNHERLTDTRSIEKWLGRNCKWTLGRECTPQEKGDLLMYLKGL